MRVRPSSSVALAAGSAVSGLLAYVFFALVTRALGAEGAAPVSVLWTYWGLASAMLTFPVQHGIVRAVTSAGGAEGRVRTELPRLGLLALGLALLVGLAAWVARQDLFGRGDALFPLLVVAVTLGSATAGVVRGVLAGRLRFLAIGWALVLENGLRCLVAAGLLVAAVRSSFVFGLTLVGGQLAALVWPSALRLGRDHGEGGGQSLTAFLGRASAGQVLAQMALIGGPVVLALTGGSPAEVTGLFATLALFRAPYTLALGALSPATVVLTRLAVDKRVATLRRVRTSVVVAVALVGAAAALLGGRVGPPLVRWVFGGGIDSPERVSALVAVGSVVALGSLALTVMVMAQDRSSAIVAAWTAGVLVAALVLVLWPGEPLPVTATAFLAAQAAAFVLLLVRAVRPATTAS